MLSSITPLGERSRRQRWGITVTAFVLSAAAAGAAVGAALGWFGGALIGDGGGGPDGPLGGGLRGELSGAARVALLAAGLLMAALVDARLRGRVPLGLHRQVNDRWLYGYRGWVYGAGFGAQLGAGFATVVPTAALHAAALAAFLTGAPANGAAILGLFGLARGASPLLAARVRRPEQLVAFHRRLRAGEPVVSRLAPAAQGLLALAGLAIAVAA